MHRDAITEDERQLLRLSRVNESSSAVHGDPRVGNHATAPDVSAWQNRELQPDAAVIEVHARFADRLTDTISDIARQRVTVRLRDDWLGTYSEFVFDQPLPTCCVVASSPNDEMEVYWYLEPHLLFTLLDRMLGVESGDPPPRRSLTEIEQALARVLFEQMAGNYADLWKQALSLDLVVDRIFHNAQQLRPWRGNEPSYIARYEVACGRDFGRIVLCLPWKATESVRPRRGASS